MNHIVVGMGEVGGAVHQVLRANPENKVGWHDLDKCYTPFHSHADAMHVAIPHSPSFYAAVKSYIALYNPSLVIVHSTVPVGTCDEHGWVHSPIRGVHPNIAEGIRTFVKCFGGARAEEAAEIFKDCGVKTVCMPRAKECEAAKLWDTTQYGMMIVLSKAIHKWCQDNGVDYDFVYRQANRTYNEGYEKLGRKEVARPYLKHMSGPIGGHCVIPNLPLLGENEITNFIKAFNDQLYVQDLAISSEQQ